MIVVWLSLGVPWVCLQFVIVVFPYHTHLLFFVEQSKPILKLHYAIMDKKMFTCYSFFVPNLFEEKRGSILVFSIPFFHPSAPLQVVGILCMQLLLQFYADFFETLQVFRS